MCIEEALAYHADSMWAWLPDVYWPAANRSADFAFLIYELRSVFLFRKLHHRSYFGRIYSQLHNYEEKLLDWARLGDN